MARFNNLQKVTERGRCIAGSELFGVGEKRHEKSLKKAKGEKCRKEEIRSFGEYFQKKISTKIRFLHLKFPTSGRCFF